MKTIKNYMGSAMLCMVIFLLSACSTEMDEEVVPKADRTEISRATVVEAVIEDLAAGELDAMLETKVGADNKYLVTKLTLSGTINGADVTTLHNLALLEELDIKNLRWYTNDDSRFEFYADLWDDNNETFIGEYLEENCIASYMFAGMNALRKIVLPDNITTIFSWTFFGSWNLETIEFPASLTTLYSAFGYSGLTELTIPETVTSVESGFCAGCNKLKAIYWNSSANVPYCDGLDNALLYVSSSETIVSPEWKTVMVDGVAEYFEIKAKDPWSEDSYIFTVPKPFTAKKISYTRYFNNYTGHGYSSGWETIVLPFSPVSFTHETKGVIAPFNSEVEGAKPFWLRKLTDTGFVDVTTMDANVPYIISMPNNDRYFEEYRLNGWVTFEGENVEVTSSLAKPEAVSGQGFLLQPTYEPVKQSNSIYSLNVRNDFGYNNGSVFVRGGGDVRAFEAYAVIDGRSVQSTVGLDGHTGKTRSVRPVSSGIPSVEDM